MPVLTGRRRLRGRASVGRLAGPYREALRVPGAVGFFLAALPGRIGIAMTGLGIIWLVHWGTGSFGSAGVVTGGFAIAEATAGPQVARLIDRYGQTRIVPLCVVGHGGAVAVLVTTVVVAAPLWLVTGAGVLAGATIPQFGALTAARWSALLTGSRILPTAFAMESLSNGIAFLAGPAVVGMASALIHPVVGSAFAALLVLSAGFALAAQRRTAPAPAPAPAHRAGHPATAGARSLFRLGFGVLLSVNIGLGLFFGAMQVSVTAFAVERGQESAAGPLYSVMSCTSLLAGLAYGRRHWRTSPATQLALALTLLAATTAATLAADSTGALAVVLALPGLALAPTLILLTISAQAIVDRSVLTQALTWQNSASAAGAALAASLAGLAVDALNARWGFGIAVAATVAAAATAWAARHTLKADVSSHTGGAP